MRGARQGGARLLVIIGASGSGKSSLLRAGVLPQLARRRREWILLPPIRPEKAPLETLAKAIATARRQAARLAQLARAAGQAGRRQRHRRAAQGPAHRRSDATPRCCCRSTSSRRCSRSRPRSERTAFLRLVCAVLDPARDLPLMVVATGRSDVLEGLIATGELGATDRDLPAAADAARSRAAAGRGARRGRQHQRREGTAGAHRARRRERRGAAAARPHAAGCCTGAAPTTRS